MSCNKYHKNCGDHCHASNFTIGAIVGGLLGAGIALLYAPKQGCELREDICDAYDDWSEKAEDFACDVTKKSRKAAKEFSCASSEFCDKARECGEECRDSFADKLDDVCDLANAGLRLWQNLRKR